ncbi:MAG TPA: hypothetical protein VKR31_12710 [Rhizomicrobium sp.]|nr:hypothetical protein [Rhizomicrobium sp.]
MTSSRIFAGLFLSGVAIAPAFAASPGSYTVFDAPGAGTEAGQGTFGVAVNAASSITGYFVDSNYYLHGFVRTADGTITTFDAAGPLSETEPFAINRNGRVAGFCQRKQRFFEAFLVKGSGKIEKYSAGGVNSGAYALNDNDEVVGTYSTRKHRVFGYLRSNTGAITAFQDPKAGKEALEGTFPIAVNNAGAITGQYANNGGAGGFIRDADGTFTNFKAPDAGGFLGTNPSAINQAGAVAGVYTDSDNTFHSFIRDPSGTITTFDAPGAGTDAFQGTTATSIAYDGTIVGSVVDANGTAHGFLRSQSGTIKEFDTPGAGTGSGEGTYADSTSKRGIIAGYEVDDNGVSHGFLRTP